MSYVRLVHRTDIYKKQQSYIIFDGIRLLIYNRNHSVYLYHSLKESPDCASADSEMLGGLGLVHIF